MKKLLILSILTLAFAFTANAQKVEIDQTTADKCAQAFAEVKASREAITVLQEARIIDARVIEAQKQMLESYVKLTESKDSEIKNLRMIIADYEKRRGVKISILFGLISFRKR